MSQPPHVGGSDVGSFVADTIRSSATPMHSIDPSYSRLHPTIHPPQQYIRPTPYPPELGVIRNVRAFGPMRWTEEDRGQLMRLGVIQASRRFHSHPTNF